MPADTEIISQLDLGEPTQELLNWAKEHIREDPNTRCQVIEEFRDMIYSRGECTPHRADDAFLLRFLRARNFVLESAHRLLVSYYDFKEENPQFFENVGFTLLNKIGDHDVINVPPYRDQNGRRIMTFRLGNWDPEIFTIDEVFQATLLILSLAILEQRAQIMGGICIFDLGGLSMQQFWYMNPGIAHKVVQIMVSSFYYKVHALHVVNQSYMFDMAFNIFKPFLEDRMKERIFFHGDNMESLHKYLDPKWLPERYGGVRPHYNYNDWIDWFKRTPQILKEMESLGYKTEEEEK